MTEARNKYMQAKLQDVRRWLRKQENTRRSFHCCSGKKSRTCWCKCIMNSLRDGAIKNEEARLEESGRDWQDKTNDSCSKNSVTAVILKDDGGSQRISASTSRYYSESGGARLRQSDNALSTPRVNPRLLAVTRDVSPYSCSLTHSQLSRPVRRSCFSGLWNVWRTYYD